MDDPALMETSYSIKKVPSIEKRKQTIYINLQLQFWLMLWEIDSLPEATLRGYAADLFSTGPGQEYWKNFAPSRISLATGARGERKFFQIVNDEYQRLAPHHHRRTASTIKDNRKLLVIASALIGVAAGAALARSRSGINSGCLTRLAGTKAGSLSRDDRL
jgi:hypothetical protein